MASKRQLGGNLGHLKAILRPKRGQEEFHGSGVGGMREAVLSMLQAISRMKSSGIRHCGQAQGRRRIQARRAGPRRRPNGDILHATLQL